MEIKILGRDGPETQTETESVDSVQIQTCVLQFSLKNVEVYDVKPNLVASQVILKSVSLINAFPKD